ncbi:MAG TPA: ATP-grasp domain-containing protein [Fimbriimonadaceae bacterium]|nr:ATP-grasp domain-containing protein [Fimbriimonadaceae bacterium]
MEFDIGFLGGGQLARMSIQAAQRMGLKCLSLDPGKDTPASQVAPAIQGALADPERVAEVFARCRRVTLENEFIPAESIRTALEAASCSESALTPTLDSLAIIQDKLRQRQAYAKAGVPSPRAVPIEGGIPQMAFPMVLKARFGGYDGKGTRYARTEEEFESHRALWEAGGWMAEEFVPFRRELATMVFISDRQTGCFPTMETIQKDHICDLVFPADNHASEIAIAAVEAVGGKGLYGVELFELENGEVLVNELAPRPHNTGHYTLDWGGVSQFEQHVRLVMGFPLVEPAGMDTCMANLLGQEGAGDFRAGLRAALENDPGARVHWYGKAESRPGRKMGHLNVAGEDSVERAVRARALFYRAWTA